MLRTKLNIVSAMTFALFMSGCGKLDFTLTTLLPNAPVATKATAQGVEAISSASVAKRTVNDGYLVEASVGSMLDKQMVTTTPGGYKIYNGVRGSVASEN